MPKNELDTVKEELDAYIGGLYPQEKEEVKDYLRRALALHMQVVHQDKPGELLGELVTQAYLERIIPNEATALAYLRALTERDDEIRSIEGEKWDVARRLVDPYSLRGRLHMEMLARTWGLQDGQVGGDDAALAVRMAQHWGDPNDTLDTWAEAELTRVKMQSFISGLAPVKPSARKKILRGTKLAGTKVPLRTWIIATAIVAQAKISSTPKMLRHLFVARETASRVLMKMRRAMVDDMRAKVATGNPHPVGYHYVYGLDPGYCLYYKKLDNSDALRHRHDLVLRGMGKFLVASTTSRSIEFVGGNPRPADQDDRIKLMNNFERWISPHLDATDRENNFYYLYEYAYRYNADKKRLLGWGLINQLLRSLLFPKRDTDEP